MKLNNQDLAQHLIKDLAPIYLISGDEPRLAAQVRTSLLQACQERGFSERLTLSIDPSFNWQQLSQTIYQRSLFADKRIIELQLSKTTIGKEGSLALCNYCTKKSQEIILLIFCPKLDSTQQTTSWVKAIISHGVWIPIWPVSHTEWPHWLKKQLTAKKVQLSPKALALLCTYTEGNLLAADQACMQLQWLTQEKPAEILTEKDIAALFSTQSRYEFFDFIDSILSFNLPHALNILSVFEMQGTMPFSIIWTMIRELQKLTDYAFHHTSGQTWADIFRREKIWPKRQLLLQNYLQRFSTTQLQTHLQEALFIEQICKGLHPEYAPWPALLHLVTKLCPAQ